MNGWIRLHRKFLNWKWFDDPQTIKLFIYLLLSASWEDKEWKDIIIKRGQFVCSVSSLSKATGISVRGIRTRLDRLQKTREIDKQTDKHYTIITICNYDSYQTDDSETDKQADKQTTNERQHLKNIKNIKKKKYKEKDEFIVEIIDYLNERTNKSFKYQTEATKSSVRARIAEGYTVDDFKKVIDIKAEEWLGTEMDKYLNPSTLFRPSNFEKYLNQVPIKKEELKKPTRGIR